MRSAKFAGFLVLGVFAAATASAETINFTNQTAPNGTVFTSDTQGNFTATATAGTYQIGQRFGDPVPDLYVYETNGTIDVTRNGGGDFTFSSVDFAAFTAARYVVVGSLGGQDIFTDNGTLPATDAFATYETGFSSDVIDSLSIRLADPTGEADLDNIVVTRAAAPVSATPEPSSLMLLGTGFLGAVGMARRRFHA